MEDRPPDIAISKLHACQYTVDPLNKPFWNDKCAEYSTNLPLQIIPGKQAATTYRTTAEWNDSLLNPRVYHNSPSDVKITAQSLADLPISNKSVDSDTMIRTASFRMKLSPQMRSIYKRWMNVTRHVYNAAIDVFRLDRKAGTFTVRDNLKYGQFAKMIEECTFPIEAFTQAVCEAKRTVMGGGDIKQRKCDDLTSTMYADGIRDGVIYPINMSRELQKVIPLDANISRTAALKAQKKVIDNMIKASKVNHGTDRRLCKVTFNRRCGKFTVQIPAEENRFPPHQSKLDEVVAVDPGVRTIATFYSEHYHGYLGEDWYRRTVHLKEKADHIAKQAGQCDKFYTKHRLRKRAALINQKVTNRITNMQHQTAAFLAKNFQVILLPDMEVDNMIRADKLPPSVSRVIRLSSQYRFRQIMIQKAEKYSANVILCKEYHTSRTCTRCGSDKIDLGSSKTYQCAKCGLCVDRDYNGARNIMLKHLTLRGDGPSTGRKKLVRSRLSLKKGKPAP